MEVATEKATKWKLDQSHSEVQFKIKHLVISTVTGNFSKFDGTFTGSEKNLEESSFVFDADINSISTNNSDRDTHLMSADFFDAETHPSLKFESSKIEANGDDLKIKGNIEIKGIKKEITLEGELGGVAVDPYGQTKIGFEFKGKINRKDFGLTWNALTEAGGMVVSDEVKLIANIQFIQQ